MSDLPFGFSQPGDDNDDAAANAGSGGAGNFGFGFPVPGTGGGDGPAGFDPAQLGQMFTQLGQMFSQSGASGTQPGPVNYDLASQLALSQLGNAAAVREGDKSAVIDAVHLAELWLDGATPLPTALHTTEAWAPKDWVTKTLPAWRAICSPVAESMTNAWVEGLPPEVKQMAGPMVAMMGQMGGMAFGTQLGQGLAVLAAESLSSTGIGLPMGPDGVAALLPEAITAFAGQLGRPVREVLIVMAAREAVIHRLYRHVPWLRQRVLATVNEYASGITIDFSKFESLAGGFDISSLSDPSAMERLLAEASVGPSTTPAQLAAQERLETLLSLVEGWVDVVTLDAVSTRLPGADALVEAVSSRRIEGGPAEATFADLLGLSLRPRRLREAAQLWRLLAQRAGASAREALWDHPDLLPITADLADPTGFVERHLVGGSSDLDDPIAALERTIAAEAKAKAAKAGERNAAGDETTKDGGPEDGATKDGGPGDAS